MHLFSDSLARNSIFFFLFSDNMAVRSGVVTVADKVKAVQKACQELQISVFVNGNLRPKSDILWATAANYVSSSPGTLYLNFKLNWHDIVQKFNASYVADSSSDSVVVGKEDGTPLPHADVDTFISIGADDWKSIQPEKRTRPAGNKSGESTTVYSDVDDEAPVNPLPLPDVDTYIAISADDWKSIQPEKRTRPAGNKSDYSLQGDYKDIFLKVIYRDVQIACRLCFSNFHVRSRSTIGKPFIEIVGYCSECRAEMKITAEKELLDEDGSIKFRLVLSNRKDMVHRKKFQLK